MNQFQLPLSAVQNWKTNKTVKAKLKLTVHFTMTNGGSPKPERYDGAIIIHRLDVERVLEYARLYAIPRDYLIVKLPIEIGLRTSEISTLRIEDIQFDKGSFNVLDSKKYRDFPLPLGMMTLQQIQDLIGNRQFGYVIRQVASWIKNKTDQPLSPQQIWNTTVAVARRAGVRGYNPRMGRAYFAKKFYDETKDIASLSVILRHKKPEMSFRYIMKITFFEDVEKVYRGIQSSPVVQQVSPFSLPTGEHAGCCGKCGFLPMCKAPLPPHAEGCRYLKVMEEQKT